MTPSRISAALDACVAAALALCLQPPLPIAAQQAAPAPPLSVAAIKVEPAAPAVDTLCRLTVALRNDGDGTASQLRFTVRLNGEALKVYERQLYYQALPAGETSEVRLYNFWTTETGRPRPADGRLLVEVVLEEAQWMKIEREGETETWTPQGEVPGLPQRSEVALQLP